MNYTDVMKARMIKRMTGPRAMTASALSEETGIPQPTLSRWLRGAGTVGTVSKSGAKTSSIQSAPPTRLQDWTAEQKVKAVMETAALSEEERGVYLRRNGLHSEQLDQWRQQVIESATGAFEEGASRGKRGGSSAEHKRIRELERQLRRKDKALAETTTLLVLKKKFEAMFEDEEDDTSSKNGG